MNFEQILYEKDGPILTITLNRPDKLNAFTGQMMQEIIEAMDAADADDEVRAIIFTGAGRGFCAGADLSAGKDTFNNCLLYTSPSPRDLSTSRMPSSA